MNRWLFSIMLLLIASLAGCGASTYSWLDQSGRHGGGGSGGGGGGPVNEVLSNDDVFRRLTRTCEGCHGVGAFIPSFSSLASFENMIVYNPSIVVTGSPDMSLLVKLLEGTLPNGRQMPPAGRFADLAARGQTNISMAQIRRWISQLQPRPGGSGSAGRDAIRLQRKTAEQALETLRAQLGLTERDFFASAGGTQNEPYFRILDNENYPARSPDDTGIIVDYGGSFTGSLFIGLGGPNLLNSRKRNKQLSPVVLQTWIPLSQAWCRTAVEKPNNRAFFRDALLTDSSDSPEGRQRIRNNIAYLFLRMLGDYPTTEEVDDLFSNIFVHYLPTTRGPAEENIVPWTAVCAALAQDPLWLTY